MCEHLKLELVQEISFERNVLSINASGERTCSGLLYKLPNFFKFHEFNQNSYDYVAEVLLVHNC